MVRLPLLLVIANGNAKVNLVTLRLRNRRKWTLEVPLNTDERK